MSPPDPPRSSIVSRQSPQRFGPGGPVGAPTRLAASMPPRADRTGTERRARAGLSVHCSLPAPGPRKVRDPRLFAPLRTAGTGPVQVRAEGERLPLPILPHNNRPGRQGRTSEGTARARTGSAGGSGGDVLGAPPPNPPSRDGSRDGTTPPKGVATPWAPFSHFQEIVLTPAWCTHM